MLRELDHSISVPMWVLSSSDKPVLDSVVYFLNYLYLFAQLVKYK